VKTLAGATLTSGADGVIVVDADSAAPLARSIASCPPKRLNESNDEREDDQHTKRTTHEEVATTAAD
jgi:hypothetical protein